VTSGLLFGGLHFLSSSSGMESVLETHGISTGTTMPRQRELKYILMESISTMMFTHLADTSTISLITKSLVSFAHSSSYSPLDFHSRWSLQPSQPRGRIGIYFSSSAECLSFPSHTGCTHSSTGHSREASPSDEQHTGIETDTYLSYSSIKRIRIFLEVLNFYFSFICIHLSKYRSAVIILFYILSS